MFWKFNCNSTLDLLEKLHFCLCDIFKNMTRIVMIIGLGVDNTKIWRILNVKNILKTFRRTGPDIFIFLTEIKLLFFTFYCKISSIAVTLTYFHHIVARIVMTSPLLTCTIFFMIYNEFYNIHFQRTYHLFFFFFLF